jgi:hypothetical protein
MPTNTYVALDKVTVGTATPSITFTGISGGYTDLVVVFNGSASVTEDFQIQVNSDTGSNYSRTVLTGNGTNATSNRSSTQNYMRLTQNGYLTAGNSNIVAQFMNYSNTTTNKIVLSRANNTPTGTDAIVNLWRSTSAITSIYCYLPSGNFAVGSTFSLYGIKAEIIPTAKATGGQIFEDATYVYHLFGSSGTFTPNQSLTCDYLVVAGGGGGGSLSFAGNGGGGGGGGAGGLRSTVGATGGGGSLETALSLTATGYTVTVGAGGIGGSGIEIRGTNGSNSVFSTITSIGGGGGGVSQQGSPSSIGPGISGGSGGGAGGGTNQAVWTVANGTANQGYAGGVNTTAIAYGSGGGGGAGSVGQNGSATTSGNGGNGVSITGWATATGTGVNGSYAGGGGGGLASGLSAGTTTGGGGTSGRSGIANTGGGGGGIDSVSSLSGRGGSGVVIVRYLKA